MPLTLARKDVRWIHPPASLPPKKQRDTAQRQGTVHVDSGRQHVGKVGTEVPCVGKQKCSCGLANPKTKGWGFDLCAGHTDVDVC